MPISIKCVCGKSFDLPDHMAGKKGKCAGCGRTVEVPEGLHLVHETVNRQPLPAASRSGAKGGPGATGASKNVNPYVVLGVVGGVVAVLAIAVFAVGSPAAPAPALDPLPDEPAPKPVTLQVEAGDAVVFARPVAAPGDVTLRPSVVRSGGGSLDGRDFVPIRLVLDVECAEPAQVVALTARLDASVDEAGRTLRPLVAAPERHTVDARQGVRAEVAFVPPEGEPARKFASIDGSIDLEVAKSRREVRLTGLSAASGVRLAHPAFEEAGLVVLVPEVRPASEVWLAIQGRDLMSSLVSAEFVARSEAHERGSEWNDREGTVAIDFGDQPVPKGIEARLVVSVGGTRREIVLQDLETRAGSRIHDPALIEAGIELTVGRPRHRVRLEIGGSAVTAASIDPPAARSGPYEWRVKTEDLAKSAVRLTIHAGVVTVRVPIAIRDLEIPAEK